MAESPEPKRRRHKTDPPPLSAREIRFCQIWVETGNGTRSYIDAGFPHGSENSAKVMALRLLRKVTIREYIRTLQQHASEAAKVTVEELAAAMAGIVRADRRRLYDRRGRILLPHEWPDDVAATVEQVDSDELFEPVPGAKGKKRLKGYTRKVKTASRVAAAAKLMEWKRMTGSVVVASATNLEVGADVRNRIAEVDSIGPGQPGEAGRDLPAVLGNAPPPA